MTQIDYEIAAFYKAILHLFLASGALEPLAVNILWTPLPPHYEPGSNETIPLNIEDNQAPHKTFCVYTEETIIKCT